MENLENNPETNLSQGDNNEEELDMGALLAQEEAQEKEELEGNAFVTANVVSIVRDGALVDIGLKGEALIPRSELGENVPFKVGDTITVMRLRGKIDGHVHVSYKAAKDRMAWDEIAETFKRKMPVHIKIRNQIKGGVAVELENGLGAFLPSSQIDLRPVSDIRDLKGKTFTAYITEFDPDKNNLVVSRRQFLAEEKQKKRGIALENVAVGQVRKGTVTGIASFGAFVDLGGVEGLLHIGEIDWTPNPKISKILKTGQEVEVKIIQFDSETGKISLSRKQLLEHPWTDVENRFKPGNIIEGKVVSITDFGAFVELDKNVEGLVHSSEFSWKDQNVKPKNIVKIGETVKVKILNINRQQEKIALSIKRTGESPWVLLKQKYPVGSKVKVVISSLADFGAFAKIAEENMEGLIHISDFTWLKRLRHPEDAVKIGDQVEVKILEIDTKKEKMSFGIKQLQSSPYGKYSKGQKVQGKALKVEDFGVVVELEEGVEAFVPASEVSGNKFEKPQEVVKEGEIVDAKVIAVEQKDRKITLSIKQFERDLQRAVMAKYSGQKRGPALGDLFE